MHGNTKFLKVSNIVKHFPGTRAVDGVDFECAAGEIHCVVGENGAGKSTLMKLLVGIYQPDEGTIEIEGKPVSIELVWCIKSYHYFLNAQ